jgi:DNA/RNA endonuclease G (NUC1)
MLGYSFLYKAPIWVSYKLTEASVTLDHGRGGDPFAEDELIPVEARSTLWDYKYSVAFMLLIPPRVSHAHFPPTPAVPG